MNRRTLVAVMLVAGSLSAALLGSRDAEAVVSNADYTAVPAFVSNATTPNIIVVMDNSGSMSNRACESSSCGTLADGSTSTTPHGPILHGTPGTLIRCVAIPTTQPILDSRAEPARRHWRQPVRTRNGTGTF
jgi:hypothetical protein